MSKPIFDALHLIGQRVLSNEQVDALEQVRRLDQRLRQRMIQTRLRLAARLRQAKKQARRKGYRQGLQDGMREVADVFAEDLRQWKLVGVRIEQAVAKVLQDATLALPKSLLIELQLRKCLAVLRDTAVLRVHVNASMYQEVLRMMGDEISNNDVPACEVVVTEYLSDGTCIIETAHGMLEGRVERELAAFFGRVTAALKVPDEMRP